MKNLFIADSCLFVFKFFRLGIAGEVGEELPDVCGGWFEVPVAVIVDAVVHYLYITVLSGSAPTIASSSLYR